MKYKSIILLIILSVGIIFAGVDLLKFTARAVDGTIIINWQAASETNVKNYILEKKTINGSYVYVATINLEEDKDYEYIDRDIFKTNDQMYSYRLEYVDSNNKVNWLKDVSVRSTNISSVKRTWGSIKALFR